MLINKSGSKIINNNTLVGLTLMLAQSNPDDKDLLIKVIENMIHANK